MKLYADKKRRDVHFDVGDWVFLKLRPHRQQSVVKRIHQKLAPRFFGPYQIVQKIGDVAYKLQLPESSKIHPIFHVSQLKKAIGDYHPTEELPISLDADKSEVQPEKLLSWRDKFEEGHHKKEWLVKWKGLDASDATWEDELLLRSQFPDLSLEDKAIFEGGDDDRTVGGPNPNEEEVLVTVNDERPKIWRVYERKRKGESKKIFSK
jgi:hypothetical protein